MKKETKKQGREEVFNAKELEKEWFEGFYDDRWKPDTLRLTKFEKELINKLKSFLPRHMPIYDWNLPYSEAIILIIRNLYKQYSDE